MPQGLRSRLAAFVVLAITPAGATAQQSVPARASLVFDGVTIIDVEHGARWPAQRVVITGNRIQTVGDASTVKVPKGAHVIDARGKYLIPGLWDMHTHIMGYPQVFFPLLIAQGVTGIRDMHGRFLDSLLLWRREIAAGARVGPRMVVTGGFLGSYTEEDKGWFSHLEVPTAERARAVIDSLKAAGADFIKVRDGIPREVYFAIAVHARRIGIPLAGHLSSSVTAAEASDSGQHSIEHELLCSPSKQTEEQCAALARQFARNDTWLTPTSVTSLVVNGVAIGPDWTRFWPDTVPPWQAFWTAGRQASDIRADVLKDRLPSLAMLQRAGMPLLAGTDAAPILPQNMPGFSLHEELALFQQAGFSPLEALRTATLNPARYLHATDSLGTIAPGKLADLVVLDADPLEDVTHTTMIHAVVANGRYFDQAALDQLLAQAQQQPSTGGEPPAP